MVRDKNIVQLTIGVFSQILGYVGLVGPGGETMHIAFALGEYFRQTLANAIQKEIVGAHIEIAHDDDGTFCFVDRFA